MKVYRDGVRFHSHVVSATRKFPREFLYLADQLRRSSLSVTLNIAEGSAKGSDKDFNRYLAIALGSIHESMASCDIARAEKIISENEFRSLENEGEMLAKQLGGFSKHLKSV
jgi:four helix bundle protein